MHLTAFCTISSSFFWGGCCQCSFEINPKIVIDNQRVNAYVPLQVLANFLSGSFRLFFSSQQSCRRGPVFPKPFVFKQLFYLPELGLSCSTWGLCCFMWNLSLGHTDSLVVVGLVAPWHVGSQFPNQGQNLHPQHCKAVS